MVEAAPHITCHERLRLRRHVPQVPGDMREWRAPVMADLLVSELLGSWGDNELSPECLDGAQRYRAQALAVSVQHRAVDTAAHGIASKDATICVGVACPDALRKIRGHPVLLLACAMDEHRLRPQPASRHHQPSQVLR